MYKTLTKAYQSLIFLGGLLKSPLLLLSRIYWGSMFVLAGFGKLQDIDNFVLLLSQYYERSSHFLAYLAAYSEFLGGICLVIGFASRLAAIPLLITMFTAYFTVHIEALYNFFTHPSIFVGESPFNFLFCSLLILAFGPGRFSVDYLLEKWLFTRAEGIPKHQHL